MVHRGQEMNFHCEAGVHDLPPGLHHSSTQKFTCQNEQELSKCTEKSIISSAQNIVDPPPSKCECLAHTRVARPRKGGNDLDQQTVLSR
jgi:hypothetical protein